MSVYLNQDGCLSHVQKLFPLQTSSEPALKEYDLTHYILVQRVLQLLSLQLLQEHLNRENIGTSAFTCTEGNGSQHRQERGFITCTERIKLKDKDKSLVVYLSFAYLVRGGVQAHLLPKQRGNVLFRGSGVLWQQNPELLYELLQGQDNKDMRVRMW